MSRVCLCVSIRNEKRYDCNLKHSWVTLIKHTNTHKLRPRWWRWHHRKWETLWYWSISTNPLLWWMLTTTHYNLIINNYYNVSIIPQNSICTNHFYMYIIVLMYKIPTCHIKTHQWPMQTDQRISRHTSKNSTV